MNPSSGNKGVNHLAQVLTGQNKKDQDRNSALVLDFGEIMGKPCTGSIGVAASAQPDPPDPPQSNAGSGGPEGAHQHHVLIPEKMRRLKPGDRVLVAWVQSEAVVVDIICPAEDLKK